MTVKRHSGNGYILDEATRAPVQVFVLGDIGGQHAGLLWVEPHSRDLTDGRILLGELARPMWFGRVSGKQINGVGQIPPADLGRFDQYVEVSPPWDLERFDRNLERAIPRAPQGIRRNLTGLLMVNGTPVEVRAWNGASSQAKGVCKVTPSKILCQKELDGSTPTTFDRRTGRSLHSDPLGMFWSLRDDDLRKLAAFEEDDDVAPEPEPTKPLVGLHGMRKSEETKDDYYRRLGIAPPKGLTKAGAH